MHLFLLLLFLTTATLFTSTIALALDCHIAEDAGPCDPLARWPKPDCDLSSAFYTCLNTTIRRSLCPHGAIFDVRGRRCANLLPHYDVDGKKRYRRQSATGVIGQSCSFNIDCGGGGGLYCTGGLCACTSGFVQSQVDTDRCLQKINPNQNGCTENIQCSSVWFGTRCTNGQCQCNDLVQDYVVQTRDGTVCVRALAGVQSCPLPPDFEIDGTTPQAWQIYTTHEIHLTPHLHEKDGTRCNLGRCECSDTVNEYTVQTRDGTVCVRDQNNGATLSCPLPAGLEPDNTTPQGQTSILYPAGGTTAVACTNNPTTQTFAACQVPGQPGISDLYDCIPRRQNAGMHCCPNRAFTCLEPLNTGGSNGNFQRWWYNSVTDSCQNFVYTGRTTSATGPFPSGNSNNFGSQQSCESYCRDRCTRGQPGYTTGVYEPATTAISCSSVSACTNSNYECQTVGTTSRCCNTPAFICGINGGLSVVPVATPTTGFDGDGNAATAVTTLTRWYYSELDRTCRQFIWSQYGGSFNNFATQDECQAFCLDLCTYGEPLKVDSGINSPNKACPCPSDYTCTNSVCCPTTELICNQARNIGNACTGVGSSYVTRYFYNSVTQRCESFTYGGCNGNLNNFEDESTCITACASISQRPTCPQGRPLSFGSSSTTGQVYTTCSASSGTQGSCPGNYECINGGCCPARSYTCSLTYNVGTVCGASSVRYYYDTTTGRCNSFTYLGCDGNSNNFGAQTDCESYCGSGGCPNGGTPSRDVTTNAFLNCALSNSACPSNYECSQVLVNSLTTQSVCCPSRTYVCSLGAYTGDSNCGTGGTTRYYFDVSSRACRAFIFNGCGANENNFITVDECNNYCGSAACDAGSAVLGGGGASAQTCVVGDTNSCPTGYTCVRDTLFNRNVCCGAGDQGVCSYGETAYIEPTSIRPRRCQPGTAASCPTDYFCRLNTQVTNGEYVCCRPTIFCASGYLPALGFDTSSGITANRPVACYINGGGGFGNFGSGVATSCPSSYSCQNTVPGSPTGYCCSLTRVCPSGFELYRLSGGTYQTCSPGSFSSCPANYRCVANTGSGATGYCCGQGSSSEYCGATGRVLTGSAGAPRTCSPPQQGNFNNRNECPSGYSCIASGNGQYYCCAGVSGVCGTGQAQLVGSNQIQLCNRPNDSVCGGGYSCTLNANNGQYYCCTGGTSACPSPGIPQRVNGGTVACNPTISGGCEIGYNCIATSGSSTTGICCSGLGATVCGLGFRVYQPGGTPVTCELADNRCGANRVCKLYATSNTYYCCEPETNLAFCPDSGNVYSLSGQPQTCTPSINSCPTGYSCSFSPSTSQYYCCSQTGSLASCPQGGILQARTCSPQVPGSCQGGTCQLISGNGVDRYQCCADPNASLTCTNGQVPTSTLCSPAASTCVGGTICLQVTGTGRFQCCPGGGSTGSACPSGGVATAVPCSQGSLTCGNGNSCQFVNGRNVCCTGGGGGNAACPQGGTLQSDISCGGPTSSCGNGNTCQLIASLGANQYRCCFSVNNNNQAGVCPQGGGLTNTPCSPGFNTCVGGTCQVVPGVGSRCCTGGGVSQQPSTTTATCPNGGQPGQFCSPSPSDTCSQTGAGTCQLIGGRYQCCSTGFNPGLGNTGVTNVGNQGSCPQGGVPVSPARTCSPSVSSSCGAGQNCQNIGVRYQCCTTGNTINTGNNVQTSCGSGLQAYVNPSSGANQRCQANNPNGCPNGFTCQNGICCSGFTNFGNNNNNNNNGNTNTNNGNNFGNFNQGCDSSRRYKYPFVDSNGNSGSSNADLGCVIGGPGCPSGYSCQSVPDVSQGGVCCRNLRARSQGGDSFEVPMSRNSSMFGRNRIVSGPVSKECVVLPCLPGQIGCTSSVECVEGHCENKKCICPPNKLISPYGKCTSSCGPGYRNEAGACVPIGIVKLADDTDSDTPKNGTEVFEILDDLLYISCSGKAPCKGEGMKCNEEAERCECESPLKPQNGTSCALP